MPAFALRAFGFGDIRASRPPKSSCCSCGAQPSSCCRRRTGQGRPPAG